MPLRVSEEEEITRKERRTKKKKKKKKKKKNYIYRERMTTTSSSFVVFVGGSFYHNNRPAAATAASKRKKHEKKRFIPKAAIRRPNSSSSSSSSSSSGKQQRRTTLSNNEEEEEEEEDNALLLLDRTEDALLRKTTITARGKKTKKNNDDYSLLLRKARAVSSSSASGNGGKKKRTTTGNGNGSAQNNNAAAARASFAQKKRAAEKYKRGGGDKTNGGSGNNNRNNNINNVKRNKELDSMRPGERIVKAMENIRSFGHGSGEYYYSSSDNDDDDEEFYEPPVNFDLVEVDSTEVERLYKSLERDPRELSADDEFKDLLLEHSRDYDDFDDAVDEGSRSSTSSGRSSGSSSSLNNLNRQRRRYGGANNNSRANADVFHLKDVARAVINPSSSLAQHNLDEKNAKIEKDPNHKFGTSTINFAIKELGDRNDFSRAYALYRWMSTQAFNDESKYSPNAYTFCALASSAKTSREVRIVLEVWRGELKIAKHRNKSNKKNDDDDDDDDDTDFDASQSWLARNECASAAIAMTTKIGDWQSALEIFNDVKKIGNVKRNIYTYTAILTALRDSGRAEEAEAVLYEMLEEKNVRVTSLAFSLALGAFEVARMWQEGNKLAKSAFKVFQIDFPDATLTHAIITMAGRAGDLQFASETFENMKNSTLVVTTYSYNALLGGYARYGDWENANRVFSDLRQAHLQPDRYTYTQLISAAERAGEYEAADVVWREMLTKSRHVVPHTVMCGAYIHCLARQRRNLEAEDVLETMKARWDVPRNAAVYNALIGAHVRAGDVPKALQVYDRMQKEDNITATEITFAVLIRACEEDGEFVKMADLLQQAKALLAREGKLVMDLSGGGGRGSLF